MTDSDLYATPILQLISDQQNQLPPALNKVAHYVLRHPLKVATLTIDELARASGSSTAAVNRLARALGLNGYIGLKSALLDTLQAVVSPVDKLRQQVQQRDNGHLGLGEQLQVASSNLQHSLQAQQETAFAACIDALCAARRVYVLGLGNSAYLAGLTAINLAPFVNDARGLGLDGGNENAAYRLAAIGADDVLLAISLPRYSRATLQLANYACERGATVLAVTDSPAAPLSAVAQHSVFAGVEHPALTSANAAALAILEAITAAVMTRNPDAVSLSEELSDSVLSYLHLASPNRSARATTQRKP